MRSAIKIASIALQGAFVVAALGAAAILVVPRLFGWQTVTVVSGSMAPAYPIDAQLAIAPVDPADLRIGDVVAFRAESSGPMVAHRIVNINDDAGNLSFVTKGDANDVADINPVAASAVRGRVVFGVPYLGRFVRAVRSPVGFAAFLVLPGIMLIGQEVLTIRRSRRKMPQSFSPLPPPVAGTAVAEPEPFEFWKTIATEERYYAELEHEVHR